MGQLKKKNPNNIKWKKKNRKFFSVMKNTRKNEQKLIFLTKY